MSKEFCEERKLGKATHCEEALQNQSAPGMGRRGERLPDGVDLLSLLERQDIQ